MCNCKEGGKVEKIIVVSQIVDKILFFENEVFSSNPQLRSTITKDGYPFAVVFFKNGKIFLQYL